MARLARGLFDETWLVLLGTIRRDDFPRISPVEPLLFAGELYLGMMWQPRKAQDLQRDPRCTVMNAVHDRMVRDGEFKLTGIAAEVTDTTERQAYAVAAPRAPGHHGAGHRAVPSVQGGHHYGVVPEDRER